MPRPQRNRKVSTPPKMIGFKPYGQLKCKQKIITLNYDEFEGFKYINYDNLQQDEAAAKMDVSRPTFTRLYNNALKKIATAFVEGQSIEIVGGNVQFDKEWLRCMKCYKLIDGNRNHIRCANCEFYGREELVQLIK
jgi:predicted DNA-binding protein (UPF0251 family)